MNPARDCFPLMRPLNFPLATIFEVVENLNIIPLPGQSCLCWDLLQEFKKRITEICECPCTWWLKSRSAVATGELFSFTDVLMLEVRWRGRGITAFFKGGAVLFEILCIQTPCKAHAAHFWPGHIVRMNCIHVKISCFLLPLRQYKTTLVMINRQ